MSIWLTVFCLNRAQFLRFSTDKKNKELSRIMDSITKEFSDDSPREDVFMLWRGQQMAIGEVMTLSEGGQLYCMGYAAFTKKCEEDQAFRGWFESIEEDIMLLDQARRNGNLDAPNKLRRLQHLLIDLVKLLNEDMITSAGYKEPKVHGAQNCRCRSCPGDWKANSSSTGKQEQRGSA